MTRSRSTLYFLAACLVLGVFTGMFSTYLVAHGERAIPLLQQGLISVAGAGVLGGLGHLLRGNRPQARASGEADRLAKQFTPVAERAVVYLFRDAFYGKFLGIDVFLDDAPLGQTRGKTYFRLELRPGEHVLSSRNPQDGSVSRYHFVASACSLGFLVHDVRLGGRALAHGFAPVEATRAAARIRRCRLLVQEERLAAAA